MTESTGGSDVGRSATAATLSVDGSWSLHGKKWFTSAATSQMALTLARPIGNASGGQGLAMFYVECRDQAGHLNGIRVERLKDKLGTRKVPTAELLLEGTRAELVAGTTGGTRAIEPMLRITRTWNSVCAASIMRHAQRLAADYARRRTAFGAPLAALPSARRARGSAPARAGARGRRGIRPPLPALRHRYAQRGSCLGSVPPASYCFRSVQSAHLQRQPMASSRSSAWL